MKQFLDDLRSLVVSGATDERFVRALLAVTPHVPRIDAGPLPENAYRRILLHAEPDFELLLMQWNGTLETPVHDHGGQRCWFTVIDGAIGVENYRCTSRTATGADLRAQGSAMLHAHEIDARLTDEDVHKCFVSGSGATTLHVYAHPLGEYNVYDLRTHTFEKCRSHYDERLSLLN